jgi:chemotaxis protein methyltransferase CheR
MRRSLSPSLLSGSSEFVAAHLGLHFPEQRWADLERGLTSAARELGHPDAEQFAAWLVSAPLTRAHIEILASHLTIGETYFFRENESLEVFEQRIVPELLRSRHDGEQRLRIWSAGCSTGEEPYSIAMLLDGLIPDRDTWNVTILATDINPHFLRKAAEGIYGEWSFRGTPAVIRQRYFSKRKDGRFELHPRIRSKVSFSYLNLATDAYPSLVNNTNSMDVIFCRNVLMYFSEERTREVTRKFYRSLVPGGWLIVSGTETANALFPSFSAVHLPGAVLYRKPGGAEEPKPVEPATLPLEPPPPSAPPRPVVAVATEIAEEPATRPASGHLLLDKARQCANEGKLADAAAWCEQAISIEKMNPAQHYLLATIRQEQGEAEAAIQSLKRALYLDPTFALAHFGLANIELSMGRQRQARRHFANALAALGGHAHDEVLPESEGLTAGRLDEIITSVLASLPGAGMERV